MTDRNAVMLFESGPREVEFTSGKLKQNATRTVTWQGVDGVLSLCLRICGSDGQVIDEQTTDLVYAKDLVVANRVVRILEELPVLNENSLAEACAIVGSRILDESDTGFPVESILEVFELGHRLSQILGAQLSDGLLERIQVSVSPDLESMIRRLQQAGIKFSTRAIRHEIDQGRVEVTTFFRRLGLEKKEVLEARQRRLLDKAADFAPLFLRFLATKKHAPDCPCLGHTMQHVVACLERGVDDMSTVVAMSLFRLAEEKAGALAAVTEIPIFPGFSMMLVNPDAQASGNSDFDAEKEMNYIAGWVSERMNGNPRAIADEVRTLCAKWEKMPITAE